MLNAPSCFAQVRGWFRLRLQKAALFIVLAGLTTATAIFAPTSAKAIEIFGLKLFEPAADEGVTVVDPLNYTVTLNIEGEGGDEGLRTRLEGASELIQSKEKPVSGSVGLISRSNSDFEQLLGALYEDARYGGVVRVRVAGRPLEDLPPDTDLTSFEPVPVEITVVPGPQFTFGTVRLEGGEGADLDPVTFGLIEGFPARSTTILDAENKIVDTLRRQGRPLAEVSDRDIVANHSAGMLDVVLFVSPGPIAAFGGTSVEGASKVDSGFVAYMAGISPGKTYHPDELEASERRLKSLETFSSVTVRGADELDESGAVPVQVSVVERKFRYIGLGATFSSTEGGGLEAYWGHRNLFGRAEKLRVEGSVAGLGDTTRFGDLTYRGALLFEKPGVLGRATTFKSQLAIAQEDLDAYRRFSVIGKAGLTYDRTKRQTFSAGIDVEYARITDGFAANRKTLTTALPLEFVFDARDDKLDPKSGFRLLTHVAPAYEAYQGNAFVTVRGEASAYRALDEAKRFVVAGRLAGGSIIGSPLSGIPANRRFYAGGGGSVRGYSYQGVGPKNAAGNPTGGKSYFEASAELRINVTEKIGIVPFIDAGAVSAGSAFENARIRTGAGIGLRYATPFGPLRVDVAVPLNRDPTDPKYGIYAGIGQAF